MKKDKITKADLMALLSEIDDDAVLVINGKVPTGVKRLNGKLMPGYFGLVFQENPKGNPKVRHQGFTFTHWTENAKEVYETHYF